MWRVSRFNVEPRVVLTEGSDCFSGIRGFVCCSAVFIVLILDRTRTCTPREQEGILLKSAAWANPSGLTLARVKTRQLLWSDSFRSRHVRRSW